MPNRERPRCCGKAMEPVFINRVRGAGQDRVPDVFVCRTDLTIARGRKNAQFYYADRRGKQR